VDRAAELGIDALIVADIGVMDYATRQWPELRLHLSVQGSATNAAAIRFYHEQFGIQRAVLPRVLSLSQVQQVAGHSPVPLEVFGFGSLCVMVEGRCLLSSYVTGRSPNTFGACSPANADSVQGALPDQRQHLLRHRGTNQPEHPGPVTRTAGHGDRGDQD
jgi:putative protease